MMPFQAELSVDGPRKLSIIIEYDIYSTIGTSPSKIDTQASVKLIFKKHWKCVTPTS